MHEYTINLERKSIKDKTNKIEEIKKEIKNYKTVAILDLRKLPDSLLQAIRKKIRKEGKIIVAKKPVFERVLKQDGKLSKYADESNKPMALLLTNLSPLALNKFLKENKKKRAAKIDEIAPFDIIIPEGETDLPPGPALSELKSAGLNVQIKAGKIVVAKESIVAKTNEKITDAKAKALQKLNVFPFELCAKLIVASDKEYVYNYDLLNIDEGLNDNLTRSLKDAFSLSVNSNYPTQQNAKQLLIDEIRKSFNLSINCGAYSSNTIGQLLSSAIRQGMALEKFGK